MRRRQEIPLVLTVLGIGVALAGCEPRVDPALLAALEGSGDAGPAQPSTGCDGGARAECLALAVPASGVLVPVAAAAEGRWGTGDSLTGVIELDGDTVEQSLQLEAGFWRWRVALAPQDEVVVRFLIDACVTVSGGEALTLGLVGTSGGADLTLRVLTHANYPYTEGALRGACLRDACGAETQRCAAPSAAVPAGVNAALSDANLDERVDAVLGLDEFGGGSPLPTVNSPIVGVEVVLRCSSPSCAVDLGLGDVLLGPAAP